MVRKERSVPETQSFQSTCSECYMYCGLRVEVSGSKVIRVTGDPEDPVWRGGICIKGKKAPELASSPLRVVHPMKKVGSRESGKWERISWDEALNTVADRLEDVIRKYGPMAVVAFTSYPGTTRCLMSTLFTRSLGSPDVVATTPLWCEGPGVVSDYVTVGQVLTHFAYHDLRNTRCVLLWGSNPQASHPPLWDDIRVVKAKGAKLIVVDPRRTMAAVRADIWLPVRPGTDGALALGMMNVIINERLYDEDFVGKWCFGFEELREQVQKYPPGKVAQITGLAAEAIIDAARMYATTKPACMFARNGITRKPNATQACRGITILVALTGNIDIPGGNLLPKGLEGFISRGQMVSGKEWRLPAQVESQALGASQFPLWTGPQGVGASSHNSITISEMLSESSRVKAAILTGNNYVVNTPDPERVRQAFMKLEFAVGVDLFMTPTTEMADVFLPAATWFEREEIAPEFFSLHVTASKRAVPPPGEARDDNEIFIELAKLMRKRGLLPYDYIPWQSVEEFNNARLKGMGVTFEDLKRQVRIPIPVSYKTYEDSGFKTATGKVEFYSTLMEKLGYEPLPEYQELPESPLSTPDLYKGYPYILITPRELRYFNGRGRQVKSLRKVSPVATVEIHREAAEKHNIKDGDWVWIETQFGKCQQRAKVTEDLLPNVISGFNYWWYPEKPAPSYGCYDHNLGLCIPDRPPYDPIEGTNWLVGHLCRISKVSGPEEG